MTGLRGTLLLVLVPLLVLESRSFELQDTIHALLEENIHLHDQLENLTQALRELKRMLWLHGNGTPPPSFICGEIQFILFITNKYLHRFKS